MTAIPGNLKASEAPVILKQSGLTNDLLYKIWRLTEGRQPSDEHGKGFLKRNEWILNLHMIKKTKLGYPIPTVMPSNLVKFQKEYEDLKLGMTTGFSSTNSQKSGLFQTNTTSATFTPTEKIAEPLEEKFYTLEQQESQKSLELPVLGIECPETLMKTFNDLITYSSLISTTLSDESAAFNANLEEIRIQKMKAVEEVLQIVNNIEQQLKKGRTIVNDTETLVKSITEEISNWEMPTIEPALGEAN